MAHLVIDSYRNIANQQNTLMQYTGSDNERVTIIINIRELSGRRHRAEELGESGTGTGPD